MSKFYISCFITFFLIFFSLLLRDVFFSIYIYLTLGEVYLDFYFKDAFKVALIIWIPYFLISWIYYRFGKGSDYQKQKYLKEKLTYKIINERYEDKRKVDKDN